MAIDYQGLFKLVKANEEAERFDLGFWVDHDVCGTIGCLVGNFCLANPEDALKLDETIEEPVYSESGVRGDAFRHIAARFGLTHNESQWLFGTVDPALFQSMGYWENIRSIYSSMFSGDYRDCTDRAAAIARVRKFIYYKLHKQEMLYEEDGRVRESARRAEGDQHVVRKVLEKV